MGTIAEKLQTKITDENEIDGKLEARANSNPLNPKSVNNMESSNIDMPAWEKYRFKELKS